MHIGSPPRNACDDDIDTLQHSPPSTAMHRFGIQNQLHAFHWLCHLLLQFCGTPAAYFPCK